MVTDVPVVPEGTRVVHQVIARVPGCPVPVKCQLLSDEVNVYAAIGPFPLDTAQEVIAMLTIAQGMLKRFLNRQAIR